MMPVHNNFGLHQTLPCFIYLLLSATILVWELNKFTFISYLVSRLIKQYFVCCRVVHNALLLVFARDILHELVNATATPDWSAFCTRVTISVFTKAVSALYVQQFSLQYLEELRKQVGYIIINYDLTLMELQITRLSFVLCNVPAFAYVKLRNREKYRSESLSSIMIQTRKHLYLTKRNLFNYHFLKLLDNIK